MAKTLTIRAGFKWWVSPYLWVLRMFVYSVKHFADPYVVERFVNDRCEWIGENGIWIKESHA